MISDELRRSKRYADFLPIFVSVCRKDDQEKVAGPFSARIVDVSNHGACVLLTQVMLQSFHIFHSTREDESTCLVLHINVSPEEGDIGIEAKPVWLNATKIDDIKVFKMGVDFLEKIDDTQLRTINRMINTQ